jgi:hypothetical protein
MGRHLGATDGGDGRRSNAVPCRLCAHVLILSFELLTTCGRHSRINTARIFPTERISEAAGTCRIRLDVSLLLRAAHDVS